jgi:hypothetical protein
MLTAEERRGSEPSSGGRRGRRGLLPLATVLAIGACLVVLHVVAYTQLSPIDELQHVDYLIKASHGQLLRRGDVLGREALREAACRGILLAERGVPDCRTVAELPPTVKEQQGVNSEEIQPPAYYFLTGVVARVVRWALPLSSIVTAARLVGILWLGAGVAMLWAVLRRLGVPTLPRWGAATLVASAPVVLHATACVNNDATALVAGAGVLLAAVAWERGEAHWAVVAVAAFMAVAFKPTNVVGVGAAALYLVLRGFLGPDRAPRRASAMAGGLVGAALLASLVVLVIHDTTAKAGALANPNTVTFHVDTITVDQVITAIPSGVTPVQDPLLAPFLAVAPVKVLILASNWLLLACGLGLGLTAATGSRSEALAVGAIVACAVAGPAFVLVNYFSVHTFVAIPTRYSLSALPALAAALGLALRKPWAQWAVCAFAALSAAVTAMAIILR